MQDSVMAARPCKAVMSPYYDNMKNRSIIVTLAALLLAGTGSAQQNYKRIHNKMLDEAKYHLEVKEYMDAAKIYQQLLPVDTSFLEVRYELALSLSRIPKLRHQALHHFETCVRAGHTEAHIEYAKAQHEQQRFDEAIALYEKYKQIHYRAVNDAEVDRRIAMSRKAKQLVASPIEVAVNSMGPAVNSRMHDYSPLVTADGRTMYFTSRREGSTGGLRDAEGQYMEDVYVSHRTDEGWSPAVNIGEPINSMVQDATVGLSPDGNSMILYRTSRALVSGDLYECRRTGDGGWGAPELMTEKINSASHEPSANIAPNGEEIYFTSDRPGGFGGRDLYRIRRLPNGEWSLPLNLGPNINTPYDEDAPFLHSDGKTMFFSSNGHATMGGYDVFKSTLLDADMNLWSEPENMGYPLNTVDDDIYFTLSEDGRTGYISSERPEGMGEQDIYEVIFPSSQLSRVVVHGLITDALDRPVKSRVVVTVAGGDEVIGVYNTNPRTGRFLMVLEPGGEYELKAEAEGFPLHEEFMEMPLAGGIVEFDHDIEMHLPGGDGLSRNE